jgi:2-methylisocitrate lyase-like PEP mutase family enzyme
MIEAAGFEAYGIGGSALAACQLGLPDVGLQSFGEYRDAVGRILEGVRLPVVVDGENGFGDLKAVTRCVRAFEGLGVGAVAFEDLVMPAVLGRRPAVVERAEIEAKLKAALAARQGDDMMIVGRTDTAYTVGEDETLLRAAHFEQLGVDALITPGLAGLDSYKRLRDTVNIPIIAVVVPGAPWFAPTNAELNALGIEAAIYPATVLWRMVAAIDEGLRSLHVGLGGPPEGFNIGRMAEILGIEAWAKVDQAQVARGG